MSMPGFIQTDAHVTGNRQYRARMRAGGESQEVSPAACRWYEWFYAPVACGFVAFNEENGINGYGGSPCAAWQIPADPLGCATLPRNRNRW
jgi:hypothetical protein